MTTTRAQRTYFGSTLVKVAFAGVVASAGIAIAFFGFYMPLSNNAAAPGASTTMLPSTVATTTSTVSATPIETSSAAATASATATTRARTATPTFQSGVAGATSALKTYANLAIARNYDQAWAMLGPGYQAMLSRAQWQSDWQATLKSAGSAYKIGTPKDSVSLSAWLQGQPFAAEIDQTHAILLELDWTKLANNNAGYEIWVANPTTGAWKLYEVR